MNKIRFWAYLPTLLLLLLFVLIPLVNLLIPTLFSKDGFISGYIDFFSSLYNLKILWRTLKISFVVTLICALLGVPTAYFISGVSSKVKGLLMALTLFPMLTNSVIRAFAWITILGKNGVINNLLTSLKFINQPFSLLYTEGSIIVGSVYLFLPTMIITLVGVMEQIEDDILEAASTLGASQWKIISSIIIPLSLPGTIVGSILVFTGTLTAYTTPQLLGGNKNMMLATFLQQKAVTLGDWSSASVIAFIMIVITLLVMKSLNLVAKRVDKRNQIGEVTS